MISRIVIASAPGRKLLQSMIRSFFFILEKNWRLAARRWQRAAISVSWSVGNRT